MIERVKVQDSSMPAIGTGRPRSRWVIILARTMEKHIGSGREDPLGEQHPHPENPFTKPQSMLQHTLDRAMKLVPEDRIVTVICKGDRKYLSTFNGNGRAFPGVVLEQPFDRGTAPGVSFGLSYISQFDMNATVLVLSIDQFAYQESVFLQYLENAFHLAEQDSWDTLLLLGAQPNRPEADCGWIEIEEGIVDRCHDRNGIRLTFLDCEEPNRRGLSVRTTLSLRADSSVANQSLRSGSRSIFSVGYTPYASKTGTTREEQHG